MLLRTIIVSIFTLSFVLCKAQIVEKVYLHLDKDIYLSGETVWFKAYLFYNNQPSYLSSNLYLAIYDDNGKILNHKRYPVFDGTCNGNLVLPDSLTSNTIRIRVFTKGLSLADSIKFHERTIALYRKDQKKIYNALHGKNYRLSFYPEGGTIIAGLQNVIAVKSTYENGLPASVAGKIIEDQSGRLVDSFFTGSIGLGKVQITPERDKTYSAVWMNETGLEQKTIVINNAEDGVLFHCEKVKNTLYCNTLKNSNHPRYNTLYLKAQWGNENVYSAVVALNTVDQWVNKINLDSLPGGVICFTLHDVNDAVLQRRYILNDQPDADTNLKLNVVKRNFSPKGENIIELAITDSLFYNLSVSVADVSFSEPEGHDCIKENLWLGHEFLPEKKWIENKSPSEKYDYYDLLMLTNVLSKNIKNDTGVLAPLDNFLSIKASYKYKNHALPRNNNLKLIIRDSLLGNQYYNLSPISQVDFIKEGLLFYDSAQINYRLDKDVTESEYLVLGNYDEFVVPKQISIKEFFTENAETQSEKAETGITFFLNDKPKKFNELQTIQEVTVKARYKNPEIKRIQELDDKYASGMFKGLARGYQLNVIDDKNAWAQSDIINYIVYRVPQLGIVTRNMERFIGDPRSGGKVLTFLDEVELPDQTGIGSISVTQVAYIKYIPGIVIGSSFTTTGGVLYIYTKKGDEPESSANTGMYKTKIKGYDYPSNFTSPDYTEKKNLLNSDMRTTLYWNPQILLDRLNRKLLFTFNNNDISKKLLIKVTGFNEAGNLIEIERIIE